MYRTWKSLVRTKKYKNIRLFSKSTNFARESMEYDFVIVGAGPAGLSTGIKLKQIAAERNEEIDVCIIEKGAEVGSHILSGNVFNPIALNELFPNWKELGAPLQTKAKHDTFLYLTEKNAFNLPTPPTLHNDGNYIISLGILSRWLGEQAENLGVEIYPGFSASEILFDENGNVKGIATGDMGLNKDGSQGESFIRGMEILASQTILSEGCRGSLSEQIQSHFNLRKNCDPQSYGIGLKEIWNLSSKKSKPGQIIHSIGWPLTDAYGGSFLYMTENRQAYVGFVVGLDYKNPYLNPYKEFQRYKTHPCIREILQDGECVSYGARAINEGGFQSIPKLTFPGGIMTGCSAGFVNVPQIKGTHYAMKTGILAAEALYFNHVNKKKKEVLEYEIKVRNSWVWNELKAVRNVKPSSKYGQAAFFFQSGLTTFVSKGREPWTLHNRHKDFECTYPEHLVNKIYYPKPDGKLTFDLLTNLQRTNTFHEPNEPSHLKIKPDLTHVPEKEAMQRFAGPETRFCPAKVYEYVIEEKTNQPKLIINSQNCIHCKTCSIKMPSEYINWTVPQGAGGPKYPSM